MSAQSGYARWALPLILAIFPLGAMAATGRWYDVELIVFERTSASAGSSEYWPEEVSVPDTTAAKVLNNSPAASAAPYSRLPADQHQLSQTYRYLQASGQYRPLLHLAWRQPPDNKTVYLATTAGSDGYPRMEGTARLRVDHYLHLSLDLLFNRLTMRPTESGSHAAYQGYRMQAHRRIRIGELHYIDHPVIGVLATVRPYETPASMQAPAADTTLQSETAVPAADGQKP